MEPQKQNREDFVFGIRAIIEAIEAGKEIDKLLIRKGQGGELLGELLTLIKERTIPVQYVPVEKINRITRKNHQGVLALMAPVAFASVETIIPGIFEAGRDPLILILDQVTDVRNFGAMVRSAECAGVDAIVVPSRGAARINSDAVKTSAGALHLVPICRSFNLKQTILYLQQSGIKILAATEKTSANYTTSSYEGPTAIIMGSEEFGIEESLLKMADERIQIPVLGKIQSLNVSVAAGVILYEAVRQRQKQQ